MYCKPQTERNKTILKW